MDNIVERLAKTDEESAGVVACNVIQRDGKFLLVQEKKPQVYGVWNLPAGHVDKGESFEQAAIREAKEETGFDVEIIRRLAMYQETAQSNIKHVFLSRVTGGEITIPEDEILDVRWLTIEEIEGLESDGKLRAPWTADVIRISQQESA